MNERDHTDLIPDLHRQVTSVAHTVDRIAADLAPIRAASGRANRELIQFRLEAIELRVDLDGLRTHTDSELAILRRAMARTSDRNAGTVRRLRSVSAFLAVGVAGLYVLVAATAIVPGRRPSRPLL